jgi:hypothetical protein
MHVILATVGTDGDVFPHLGLGAALHARGHRVTLAAPETYRARAHALVTPSLNRARDGLGLSPFRRVFRWWLSPDLVIGIFPGRRCPVGPTRAAGRVVGIPPPGPPR